MSSALHLAATLRNLGARDARLLRCVDVVAFAGQEIEVVARCQPFDDGAHRAVLQLDPRRHAALALRLHFHDGRSRLCQATPLCACRCHGLAVVHFDAIDGCGRWCFGPDDDQRTVHTAAMEPHWRAEAQRTREWVPSVLQNPPSEPLAAQSPADSTPSNTTPAWLQGLAPGAGSLPVVSKSPAPTTMSLHDRPPLVATVAAPSAGTGNGQPTMQATMHAVDNTLAPMQQTSRVTPAQNTATLDPRAQRLRQSTDARARVVR